MFTCSGPCNEYTEKYDHKDIAPRAHWSLMQSRKILRNAGNPVMGAIISGFTNMS